MLLASLQLLACTSVVPVDGVCFFACKLFFLLACALVYGYVSYTCPRLAQHESSAGPRFPYPDTGPCAHVHAQTHPSRAHFS